MRPLIAAGVYLYKHWDEVKAKAIEIWGAVVVWFQDVGNRIKVVLDGVAAFFSKTWDTIKSVFAFSVDLILGLLDMFLGQFDKNWKDHLMQIIAFFEKTWANAQAIFNKFMQVVVPAVTLFFQTMLTNIATFFQTMIGDIMKFVDPMVAAFSSIWNGVKDVTSSIFEGIKGIIVGAINWIIDKINFFISKLNEVASAGAKVSGVSAPSIAPIPRLANGGIVNSPTLALIGEAGPEAVVPLSRGGGLGTTININGGSFIGTNSRDVARMLGDMIIQELQLSHRL